MYLIYFYLGMATNNMRINTDAIESRKSGCMLNYPNPLNITVEQVEYLENKLEFYEKVLHYYRY